MSCHSCNSCNSQSSQSSSISDFFPSGYRFTSGYPKYPYYISVPVFVEEEEEEESWNRLCERIKKEYGDDLISK